MGFLFLDIESFVDPKEERSGLNPFYEKSKVIVISYNYYPSDSFHDATGIKPATFLFEWEIGSEKKLLEKFFLELEKIYSKDELLKIVGFNQLAYDLNYLFARMKAHRIASDQKLFDLLFSKARHVDLAQLGMAVGHATKRDGDFRTISQKRINEYYGIPIKESDGKEISTFYLEKRFDKIKKYCEEEFTFELLYQSLLQTFLH